MFERQSMIKLSAVLATLGSWAAGGYLLQVQPEDPDTILAAMITGIGLYFVAKGFFVGPMLWKQAEQVELLRGLGECAARSAAAAYRPRPDLGQQPLMRERDETKR